MVFTFRLGRCTISKIVSKVCHSIWNRLQPVVVPAAKKEIWRKAEKIYRERWNFPHWAGAIDGKHVRMKAPRSSASWYNYKKFHSIILFAIADRNYRFTAVDIGQYVRLSDGNVFENSKMGKNLASQDTGLPPNDKLAGNELPYVIVADEALPLRTYLLKAFSCTSAWLSHQSQIFNYRLSRARNTLENAFDILAATWRVYHHPLECGVKLAVRIVQVTVVLHNYFLSVSPACDATRSQIISIR